jgi:NTP pyrophosphatase (non-canonical NTP hydrolase)
MNFNEYQELSKETAQGYAEPTVAAGKGDYNHKLLFLALALNGEAGEAAEKVKKAVREADSDYLDDAEKELGDILWYVAQLASLLDADLDDIAEQNLDKLLDRQERGKITGEGDDR